ncbi:ankyrin repeat domain-containing protein [Arsukibacterium sp. MJ3]|uniref:ankyrin repeat domain-containing protein n=1 Tax=Arsukibacterium sp. MJ3 TaxID=1632859 RepID=UPI0009E1FD06|nr:ankyrin repeat domain-containing protein [Arsukibacterium sp. MJ3]
MDLETMFPSAKLRELAKAAGKGQISVIERLIDEGVDINAKGSQNATVLFWSMRNEKGFNYLLTKGADPNVIFGDGGTVMHWAARQTKCNLLKSALAYGGNPNLKAGMFGGSPAFATITAGKNSGVPVCLDVLLTNGADIEFRDDNGKTLLLFATALARFDIALYLLDKGANINAIDSDGRSVTSLLSSYQDAFVKGSDVERNWFKLKSRLSISD